jgi:hypothetical protein
MGTLNSRMMGQFVQPSIKGRMSLGDNKPSNDQYDFESPAALLDMDEAHDAQDVLAGISFNKKVHKSKTNREDVVEALQACGIFIKDRAPK